MTVTRYGYKPRSFEDRPRQFTRAEMRERRRKRLSVVYDGGFDLAAEIAEITGPLSGAIAHGSPTPTSATARAIGGCSSTRRSGAPCPRSAPSTWRPANGRRH